LFTRRSEALREAFTIVPEYLRTNDEAPNLSDYGPALGRRFGSLKLGATMRCFGRAGIQEFIRRNIRLAHDFATWIDADPNCELLHVLLSLVCYRRNGSDEQNLAIVERVNKSGKIFITHIPGSPVESSFGSPSAPSTPPRTTSPSPRRYSTTGQHDPICSNLAGSSPGNSEASPGHPGSVMRAYERSVYHPCGSRRRGRSSVLVGEPDYPGGSDKVDQDPRRLVNRARRRPDRAPQRNNDRLRHHPLDLRMISYTEVLPQAPRARVISGRTIG
jgi:hypothetical protein